MTGKPTPPSHLTVRNFLNAKVSMRYTLGLVLFTSVFQGGLILLID